MAQGGIPLSEWSGSGATRELQQTIKEFNVEASRQTKQMLRLTRVIAVLTLVMTIGVGVQIYLLFNPPNVNAPQAIQTKP